MKLAIVADWLYTFGGAEHVLAELHKIWPEAPIYTTLCSRKKLGPLADAKIHTSRLQLLYRLLSRHEPLLPWMPRALETTDLRDFDIIFSSSHAIGKGIIPPSSAQHICYCHTPMRYAWTMETEYLQDFHIPKVFHTSIRRILKNLRRWDLTSAKRVDVFIANSSETQRRIREIYGRESTVIHPPVSDHFFEEELIPNASRKPFFLAAGRLVPYKRFDLLIRTANTLGFRLKIVGTGREEKRLRAIAGPTVDILGFVSKNELTNLYRNAKAFLFPAYEDAGIVPLEAQACGTPVIAYAKGGALDTVKDNETGLFFHEQSIEALTDAIRRFDHFSADPESIRSHATAFGEERFRKQVAAIVEKTLAEAHHPL